MEFFRVTKESGKLFSTKVISTTSIKKSTESSTTFVHGIKFRFSLNYRFIPWRNRLKAKFCAFNSILLNRKILCFLCDNLISFIKIVRYLILIHFFLRFVHFVLMDEKMWPLYCTELLRVNSYIYKKRGAHHPFIFRI